MAGLLALAVAMGIGRFAFTPVLPMMQDDGVLTIAAGGWLASANYLGYLAGALCAVAIRIRPTLAIRAGLLVIVVTTAAMGFEHRFASWVVLRATAGFASAWVLISVSAWALARLTPLARPLASAPVFAGVGCGIAAAGGLTLLLVHLHATAAHAWIALAGLAFLMTAPAWPVFTDDVATQAAPDRSPGRHSRWSSDRVRLVLCYGAFGFGYIIPATFLPVMAREVVQDGRMFAWAWPVFGTAAAISTFSGGLSRTIGGTRRLWTISHLVMALGVCVPALVPGLASILLAAVCVGGTFVVATMAGMQEARAVAGSDATWLMATMTAAFAVGQVAGPVLVTSVTARGGSFATPLLIAGGALVVSALALALGARQGEK